MATSNYLLHLPVQFPSKQFRNTKPSDSSTIPTYRPVGSRRLCQERKKMKKATLPSCCGWCEIAFDTSNPSVEALRWVCCSWSASWSSTESACNSARRSPTRGQRRPTARFGRKDAERSSRGSDSDVWCTEVHPNRGPNRTRSDQEPGRSCPIDSDW